MSSQKFINKVLSKTKLPNIWHINNNNKLAFTINIIINDIESPELKITINGYFPDGLYKMPIITWNEIKPSKLSYFADLYYTNDISSWIISTIMEYNSENLLYSYLLANSYNVQYLVDSTQFKNFKVPLFYSKSLITHPDNWRPIYLRNYDDFIINIQNEIKFFAELKYNIYKEVEFFKNKTNINLLSPIQKKFINNNYVIALLYIIKYFSNISDFDINLFDKIFMYISNDNIFKTLWNFEIFKWNMTRHDLINHFHEFNNIIYFNKNTF